MFRMRFRRRREQRSDYRNRLRLLIGRKHRVVIRKGISGFTVQLIGYKERGDETLVEVNSKHLREYGWKGHGGNIPTAYLTGLLFGKIAAKKGFTDGIVDIGLQPKTSQGLFAVAKGVKDAGFEIPVGAELPEARLRGDHIAAYAQQLKDSEKYRKQFSAYLKSNLAPEKITEHFEVVKKKIEET